MLHEVGSQGAYANLVIKSVLADYDLHGRDAGYVTEVAMGTLRWRGSLDEVLQRCVDRPLVKLDPRVLDVLRMASYQWLIMQTPAHAAVDSAVLLTKDVAGPAPSGLVNAVMRKVVAKDWSGWLDLLTSTGDLISTLATTYAHPAWIIRALRTVLPEDTEQLVALLARNNQPPQVTLSVRDQLLNRDELLQQIPSATPGRWHPTALRMTGVNPGDLAVVREHLSAVQDEGSQIAAAILLATPLEGSDNRWLDMCAGPGGKTGYLANTALARGATVTASEPSAPRAKLVRQAVQRFDNVEVLETDARSGPWPPASFDRVLLDVPCSGLGVIRRRPELRWRRTPADVANLTPLQTELLDASVRAVRPGGVIAYVTCSPHLAETDLIVEQALARHPELIELDASAFVPAPLQATLDPGPRARLWPHRHDTDGMFISVLQRQS